MVSSGPCLPESLLSTPPQLPRIPRFKPLRSLRIDIPFSEAAAGVSDGCERHFTRGLWLHIGVDTGYGYGARKKTASELHAMSEVSRVFR